VKLKDLFSKLEEETSTWLEARLEGGNRSQLRASCQLFNGDHLRTGIQLRSGLIIGGSQLLRREGLLRSSGRLSNGG
jgi:hypothetical protein